METDFLRHSTTDEPYLEYGAKPSEEFMKKVEPVGSNFHDSKIFPQMVQTEPDIISKELEDGCAKYVASVLYELDIDPDVLRNQHNEIVRLNEVIRELQGNIDRLEIENADLQASLDGSNEMVDSLLIDADFGE